MGLIGAQLGTIVGGGLGGALGERYGGSTGKGIGQQAGALLGGLGGGLLPFKKGGMVMQTGPAQLHTGELVIPSHMVKRVPRSIKLQIKKNGGMNM